MRFNCYRSLLSDEYEKRKTVHPNFSLNSYARFVGLSPSHLNDVLKRRRGLSSATARSIAMRLKLRAEEISFFVISVDAEHARSPSARARANEELARLRADTSLFLAFDAVEAMSQWYYFAILELTKCDGFRADSKWIGKKLQIDRTLVDSGLECLFRLGLLEIDPNGKLKAMDRFVNTPVDIPSLTIQGLHLQIIEKAKVAISKQSTTRREYNSTIMALDPKKIKIAKTMIRRFQNRLTKYLTNISSEEKELYCFSNQLFALTAD